MPHNPQVSQSHNAFVTSGLRNDPMLFTTGTFVHYNALLFDYSTISFAYFPSNWNLSFVCRAVVSLKHANEDLADLDVDRLTAVDMLWTKTAKRRHNTAPFSPKSLHRSVKSTWFRGRGHFRWPHPPKMGDHSHFRWVSFKMDGEALCYKASTRSKHTVQQFIY